jgi:hypothetical protein
MSNPAIARSVSRRTSISPEFDVEVPHQSLSPCGSPAGYRVEVHHDLGLNAWVWDETFVGTAI